LISSSGTHVLSGSWFSQADATAMNAVAAATGTLLTDSSGATDLTANNFKTVSADGHWLAYVSNSLFYRESASGGVQTASLITPSSASPNSMQLSNNGRDVVYTDSTAVFFYNTDISHGFKVSSSANSSFDPSGGAAVISGDGHYVAYSDLYQNNAGTYGLEVVSARTGRAVTEILTGSAEVSKAVYTNNGGELFYNAAGTLDVATFSNDGDTATTNWRPAWLASVPAETVPPMPMPTAIICMSPIRGSGCRTSRSRPIATCRAITARFPAMAASSPSGRPGPPRRRSSMTA